MGLHPSAPDPGILYATAIGMCQRDEEPEERSSDRGRGPNCCHCLPPNSLDEASCCHVSWYIILVGSRHCIAATLSLLSWPLSVRRVHGKEILLDRATHPLQCVRLSQLAVCCLFELQWGKHALHVVLFHAESHAIGWKLSLVIWGHLVMESQATVPFLFLVHARCAQPYHAYICQKYLKTQRSNFHSADTDRPYTRSKPSANIVSTSAHEQIKAEVNVSACTQRNHLIKNNVPELLSAGTLFVVSIAMFAAMSEAAVCVSCCCKVRYFQR